MDGGERIFNLLSTIYNPRSTILDMVQDESGGGEGSGVAAVAGEGVFHGAPASGLIGQEI